MGNWRASWRAFWRRITSRGEPEFVEAGPQGEAPRGPGLLATAKERFLTRLRQGSKRDRQLAALQAGYQELLGLIRSIRTHLENQAEAQGRLLEMLQHLPGAISALQSVARSSEQQSQVLELLRRQLEASAGHDERLVESMTRFNQTLELMDETSRRSAETLSQLAERARESEGLLARVLERSERRLLALMSLLAVLTLGVAASALYFGVAAFRERAAAPPGPVPALPETTRAVYELSPPAPPVSPAEEAPPLPSAEEKWAAPEPVPEPAPPPRKPRRKFFFFKR